MVRISPLVFLGLVVHIIPAYGMDDKEAQKKTFGEVIKKLEKKKTHRLSDKSGIHGHFNPVFGEHLTTKLQLLGAVHEGDADKVREIATKHHSFVPQVINLGVEEYEKAKESGKKKKASEKKKVAAILLLNCKRNSILENVHPKTPSMNDALEIVKLSNDGNLNAAKNYLDNKQKKKPGKRTSFFGKKEISSSDSSSESGE
ncbi:MAG TPA: hypothetical protein VHO47_05750 [Candidatus Babeliales bacterium]|nr:hypothetical protein [Candidatus Babeliales bacterium]